MKAFLSSTWVDLSEEYRAKAIESLENLHIQVEGMERFGAESKEPKKICFRYVEECDIFVGVYAHRYGSILKGSSKSITQREYELARKLKKPIFCFLINENYPWPVKMVEMEPKKRMLEAFKARIREENVYQSFTTPTDLAYRIAFSVSNYLRITQTTDNPYNNIFKSVTDLDSVLEKAVRKIEQITNTDYNQIILLTTLEYSKQLRVVADVISRGKQHYQLVALSGLINRAFDSGKSMNVDNVHEHPNYLEAVEETASELIVPIYSNDALLGVVNSESEKLKHYNPKMQQKVEYLCSALGDVLQSFGWTPSMASEKAPYISLPPKK